MSKLSEKRNTVIIGGVLLVLLVGAIFTFMKVSGGSSDEVTTNTTTPATTPKVEESVIVAVDGLGNTLEGSVDRGVLGSTIAMSNAANEHPMDARNGKEISGNVLYFIKDLNAVNKEAVSGKYINPKDIKKLYEDLWKRAAGGGITLKTVLTEQDIANKILDTDPNPSGLVAIYDGSSDLEYCAVNESYFGVKSEVPGLLNQLLVNESCADYAAGK